MQDRFYQHHGIRTAWADNRERTFYFSCIIAPRAIPGVDEPEKEWTESQPRKDAERKVNSFNFTRHDEEKVSTILKRWVTERVIRSASDLREDIGYYSIYDDIKFRNSYFLAGHGFFRFFLPAFQDYYNAFWDLIVIVDGLLQGHSRTLLNIRSTAEGHEFSQQTDATGIEYALIKGKFQTPARQLFNDLYPRPRNHGDSKYSEERKKANEILQRIAEFYTYSYLSSTMNALDDALTLKEEPMDENDDNSRRNIASRAIKKMDVVQRNLLLGFTIVKRWLVIVSNTRLLDLALQMSPEATTFRQNLNIPIHRTPESTIGLYNAVCDTSLEAVIKAKDAERAPETKTNFTPALQTLVCEIFNVSQVVDLRYGSKSESNKADEVIQSTREEEMIPSTTSGTGQSTPPFRASYHDYLRDVIQRKYPIHPSIPQLTPEEWAAYFGVGKV